MGQDYCTWTEHIRADSYKVKEIKFKNRELEGKEQIKYLVVILQRNLNWQNQTAKDGKSFNLIGQMVSRNWGIKSYILKAVSCKLKSSKL